MRVYGRRPKQYPENGIVQSDMDYGTYEWVAVETTCNGDNSYCYITALVQCLRLNLQESPFYARYGIPAEISVLTQVQPDFYVARTQQYFAGFFASLVITKRAQVPTNADFAVGAPAYTTPYYNIDLILKSGSKEQTRVQV